MSDISLFSFLFGSLICIVIVIFWECLHPNVLLESRNLIHIDLLIEAIDPCKFGQMLKESINLKYPIYRLYLHNLSSTSVFPNVQMNGWVAEIAEVWDVIVDAGPIQR